MNNSNGILMTSASGQKLPFAQESDLYDLAVVGDGLVYGEDMERTNAVRFGDKTTYLTVTPKADKKIADENGLTVSFWQRNNTNTYGGGNGTNEFERYLGFRDSNGNFAYWAPGGVSYDKSATSAGNAYKNTYNIYAMLNTTWKYVTVSFDFVNNTADTYYNGTLFNTRNHDASVNTFWSTYIGVIKETCLNGGDIYFRGQFAASEKQTVTSMFDELVIEHGYIDEAGATAKFAGVKEQKFDISVDGLAKSQYEVNVIGNAANVYDKEHPNAFWFSKYNQYIEIAPKDGNLVSDGGFTLSFWEKSLRKSTSASDVNSAFVKNAGADFVEPSITNNDAWVNIFEVVGENGKDAGVCAGAVWATKADESGTDYKDASVRKFMFNDSWQFISINVDFVNNTIVYYQNGSKVANIPTSTGLTNTMNKIKYHFNNGGPLNFRKALSIRTFRNNSALEFDGLQLSTTLLNEETISNLYAAENARITNNFAAKNFVFTYMHMNEDVEGQCFVYYPLAREAYNALTDDQKEILLTDEKYAPAMKRFVAWARANSETLEGTMLSNKGSVLSINDKDVTITVISFVCGISLILCALLLIKKRKKSIN